MCSKIRRKNSWSGLLGLIVKGTTLTYTSLFLDLSIRAIREMVSYIGGCLKAYSVWECPISKNVSTLYYTESSGSDTKVLSQEMLLSNRACRKASEFH